MIAVKQIQSMEEMEKAFEIRRLVFVVEQKVDPAEEYDEYESSSTHFLAKIQGRTAGTARFRQTEKGIKLERFAVLAEHRGKGVGDAILSQMLVELDKEPYLYLHAQEYVMHFYAKHGFIAEGDRFWECEIPHFKMVKKQS